MRTVYFDCIGGASGNMLLGALLDAGAPQADVESMVRRLAVPNWALRVETVERCGLGATHVTVESEPEHVHRHLSDIEALLHALPDPIGPRAMAVFRRLAEAEGRVHRIDPGEVHFHEVGAVDAIVDIVGTVAALHLLGVERIGASAMPMGHGSIQCEHGTFPNPAPATAELLKNVPVRAVDVEAELVTPTGAALLVGLDATFGTLPSQWDSIGYGAGTRQLPFPNVVRAFVGSALPAAAETLLLLESNVDDTSPQVYGPLMDALLEAGALDVTLTPVYMKKNRPRVMISVLCRAETAAQVRRMLWTETTTLGVREQTVSRPCLDRRMESVATAGGTVRIKLAFDDAGHLLKVIPEFDDCVAAARASGVPVYRVVDEVRVQAWERFR